MLFDMESWQILKIGNKWCISSEINENEKFTAYLYLFSILFQCMTLPSICLCSIESARLEMYVR